MARIRSIKPELWGHPKVTRLSFEARLLFVGLYNVADDEGRMLGSSQALMGQVFPNDEITVRKFERWLAELVAQQMVERYTVGGVRYLSINGWLEKGSYCFQKISHPYESVLPASPESLPSPSGTIQESNGNHSGTIQESFAPEVEVEVEVEVDRGRGAESNGASAVPDPRVNKLVAGYVEDYESTRGGHAPPPEWRAAAGRAAKKALAAGESVKDIAGCLFVIADEGKNPGSLNHVLADSHAGRPRRAK